MGRPLDVSRKHAIDLPAAAQQARLHRASQAETALAARTADARPPAAGAFNAEAVRALLAQPGCVGLRYYHGRTAKGEPTLLLVGVDVKGDDMADGLLVNDPFQCPPYCSDPNDLNT